jgi:hypothetical protein
MKPVSGTAIDVDLSDALLGDPATNYYLAKAGGTHVFDKRLSNASDDVVERVGLAISASHAISPLQDPP